MVHKAVLSATKAEKKNAAKKKTPSKNNKRKGKGPYVPVSSNEYFRMLQARVLRPETVDVQPVLCWRQNKTTLTLGKEKTLLRSLLRNKKKECGCLFQQHENNINKIRHLCETHQVPILTAASLRRHHILKNHRGKFYLANLGTDQQIREAASLVESTVKLALVDIDGEPIPYWNEEEQKANYRNTIKSELDPLQGPTPDVLFKKAVTLRLETEDGDITERTVYWLEIKMFYGAASLPWDSTAGAIGGLQRMAEKYTRLFGTGAVFFWNGCAQELEKKFKHLGVVVLDNTCGMVDASTVEAHQRTWCANENGEILP